MWQCFGLWRFESRFFLTILTSLNLSFLICKIIFPPLTNPTGLVGGSSEMKYKTTLWTIRYKEKPIALLILSFATNSCLRYMSKHLLVVQEGLPVVQEHWAKGEECERGLEGRRLAVWKEQSSFLVIQWGIQESRGLLKQERGQWWGL